MLETHYAETVFSSGTELLRQILRNKNPSQIFWKQFDILTELAPGVDYHLYKEMRGSIIIARKQTVYCEFQQRVSEQPKIAAKLAGQYLHPALISESLFYCPKFISLVFLDDPAIGIGVKPSVATSILENLQKHHVEKVQFTEIDEIKKSFQLVSELKAFYASLDDLPSNDVGLVGIRELFDLFRKQHSRQNPPRL